MSYVYFILDEKSKAIKIGKSINIDERLSDLQTGNPNLLTVKHTIKCVSEYDSFSLETELHKKFEKYRLVGEWFKFEDEVFDFVSSFPQRSIRKEKRNLIKSKTLFGEEMEYFGIKNSPRCYFYGNLTAQIMDNYQNSLKLKVPFRTMKYPTFGKQLLLPYSDKRDRVFISTKKHEENMKLKKFEREQQQSESDLNTLERFF